MKSKLILGIIALSISLSGWSQEETEKEEKEVLKRPVQVSFIYPIGSNGLQSPQVINNVSLNMLAGMSYGVHGAELAGIANVVRKDVVGFQAAGIANAVGNNVRGIQAAGIANATKNDVTGVQFGGIANAAGGYLQGAQFAGIANFNQGAVKGAQIAGHVNYADKHVIGVQLSGLANYAGNDVNGAQVSGLANYSGGEVTGLQLSPLFNYSKTLNGVQIGLVNVSSAYKKGVAIGLLNFVKGGMSRFEISHDDVVAVNGSYRSGTPVLYSILTAGIDPDKERWTYGAGFGTQFNFKGNLFGNVEATISSLESLEKRVKGVYLLNRLNLNVGYNFLGNLAIVGGPVLNIYLSNPEEDVADPFAKIVPGKTLFSDQDGKWTINSWVGYRVAVRF